MVTISRAEYEKLLGQGQQLLTQNERISHLENQVALQDTKVTSIRMAIPDTMIWERILLLSDAGPMPGESLTRQ